MSEKNILNFFSLSEITGLQEIGKKEIQILKVGFFKHPDAPDRQINISKDDLLKFKENFDNKVRKVDIPINYEHAQSKAHGSKAAGWIENLSIKNEGSELWAMPRWTPEGLKHVEDEEYRYLSSEVLWEYEDNETGNVFARVLKGCALTNYPVIKGMKAINASDLSELSEGQKDGTDKNKTKEKKEMTKQELILKFSEIGVDFSEIEKKAKGFDEIAPKHAALEIKFSELEKSNSSLKSERDQLKTKIEDQEKKLYEVKFSDLVKRGMEEGKLTKAFAEGKFKEISEKNGIDFAEAMLKDLPKVVNTESKGHGQGNNGTGKNVSDDLSEIASKISTERKISFSDAMSAAMRENPELCSKWSELGR